MTKPRATWVLWFDREHAFDEGKHDWWDVIRVSPGDNPYLFSPKDILTRFMEKNTGFDKESYRILPAGRKPR